MERHLNGYCKITRHMRERMQQRGRTLADISFIIRYGTEVRPDLYVLRNRDVDELIGQNKHLANVVDRLRGWAAIVRGGYAVTCYRLGGDAGRRAIQGRRLRPRRRSVSRWRPRLG